MASVSIVPENEGENVKNECDDPEVNAMALKMKENYQKNATAAVTLANVTIRTNNTQKNNQENLHKDCEDVESIKGKFAWQLIDGHHVPYIIRVTNGEYFKYVSVRIAENQLLKQYIHYLHADIYTCISIKSNFISNYEAKLLNNINKVHADCIYGKEKFFEGKDCIVLLEDVQEFYTFLDVCNKKLQCNIPPGDNEKCGFIRINSESVVPYCTHDSQKYLPIIYFEGATESLKSQAVKLKKWNLAYLKFCSKVLGTTNEFFDSDSCTVVSLDYIKNCCTPDTNFEEYWPATMVNTHFLTNQKSSHVNPTGFWIRAPTEVAANENYIPRTLIEPAPSTLQNIAVTKNNYLNGCSASQMGSAMGHVVPPPPLVCGGNTAPVIGNTVSYSNVVQQQITTNPNIRWELTRIPERMYTHDTSNNNAYQIKTAKLQGENISCINAEPYNYSDLMVTLDDVVQVALPESTVKECAFVLRKCLNKTLYNGNSEQLAVLRENRRLRSMHPDDEPILVMLKDVKFEFSQIRTLVELGWQNKVIQQYFSAGSPSKRQRTN